MIKWSSGQSSNRSDRTGLDREVNPVGPGRPQKSTRPDRIGQGSQSGRTGSDTKILSDSTSASGFVGWVRVWASHSFNNYTHITLNSHPPTLYPHAVTLVLVFCFRHFSFVCFSIIPAGLRSKIFRGFRISILYNTEYFD
jgi:hypothetical protein